MLKTGELKWKLKWTSLLFFTDRKDVQVSGPVAHCGVHVDVLQRQTHRLAAGPHHVGQSVQPGEGRGEERPRLVLVVVLLSKKVKRLFCVFFPFRNTATGRKPT